GDAVVGDGVLREPVDDRAGLADPPPRGVADRDRRVVTRDGDDLLDGQRLVAEGDGGGAGVGLGAHDPMQPAASPLRESPRSVSVWDTRRTRLLRCEELCDEPRSTKGVPWPMPPP